MDCRKHKKVTQEKTETVQNFFEKKSPKNEKEYKGYQQLFEKIIFEKVFSIKTWLL